MRKAQAVFMIALAGTVIWLIVAIGRGEMPWFPRIFVEKLFMLLLLPIMWSMITLARYVIGPDTHDDK